MLLAIPGIALYRISNGVSRGMKVMRHDLYSKGFTETFGTIAMFLVAFAIGLRELAPVVAVLFGTGAGGLMAFMLARGLFAGRTIGPAQPGTASILRFSTPIAVYSLLNLLIMRMDVLLLGFMGPSVGVSIGTIGVFVASVEIAGGMRKVRQAFDPMFTPIIARQSAMQDRAAMEQASRSSVAGCWRRNCRSWVCFVSPAASASIFSGRDFAAARCGWRCSPIAHATNSFVGLAETVIMIQRPKLNLMNSGFTVGLQFTASLLLIPWLGATGAALGMVLAYVTQGVLRYFELRFLFNWHWPWRALARPAAAFAIALAPAVPLRLLDRRVARRTRGRSALSRRVCVGVESDRPGGIRSRGPAAVIEGPETPARPRGRRSRLKRVNPRAASAASSCFRHLRAAPCLWVFRAPSGFFGTAGRA